MGGHGGRNLKKGNFKFFQINLWCTKYDVKLLHNIRPKSLNFEIYFKWLESIEGLIFCNDAIALNT